MSYRRPIAPIGVDVFTITTSASATSLTYAYVCKGSNLTLCVGVEIPTASDLITGITYNAVAMTRAAVVTTTEPASVYMYYLNGPATGSHNIVISASGSTTISSRSASFVNTAQSGIAASGTNSGAAITSLTASNAATVNGQWMVAFCRNNVDNNATVTDPARMLDNSPSAADLSIAMAHTNGALAQPGPQTIVFNFSSGKAGLVWVVLGPSLA